MTTPPLRISLADDYDVVREGIRAIIERQAGWEVCGVATTGREAVELAATREPDVVVMDISMPDLNGLDAARKIRRRRPQTEVLIFTAYQTDDLIRQVFEAGVKSFIFKADGLTHLIDAIRALSQHKPFFTNNVSEVLFADILNRSGTKPGAAHSGMRLTSREREVVQLLAEGKSNKDVADVLAISIRTAETHRATVMRKLGLDSIASLVRYAIRNHMIES